MPDLSDLFQHLGYGAILLNVFQGNAGVPSHRDDHTGHVSIAGRRGRVEDQRPSRDGQGDLQVREVTGGRSWIFAFRSVPGNAGIRELKPDLQVRFR